MRKDGILDTLHKCNPDTENNNYTKTEAQFTAKMELSITQKGNGMGGSIRLTTRRLC